VVLSRQDKDSASIAAMRTRAYRSQVLGFAAQVLATEVLTCAAPWRPRYFFLLFFSARFSFSVFCGAFFCSCFGFCEPFTVPPLV
jgi:hypothetical protein